MRFRRSNQGFTLVELLLALTIMSMLLAAVAAAMHGSLNSYTANENLADAMQTCRAVLDRMARDIRTAQTDHSDADPLNHYDVEWDSGQKLLSLIPPDDGSDVVGLEYQLVNNELIYRQVKAIGSPVEAKFIASTDDVQVASYEVATEQDAVESDITKCVRIKLTVQIGGVSYPMTATASPRQNQLY